MLCRDLAYVHRQRIKRLPNEGEAVLVDHYYIDDGLQILTGETGGYVAGSRGKAYFGRDHSAQPRVLYANTNMQPGQPGF